MSATLTPLTMYKEIFGVDSVILKEYQSPFDSTKRLDLLIPDVTTKFTNRNEQQYIKIANYINKIVNIVPGNIIIYFPSFEILSEVIKFIKISKPKIIQQENSSVEDFDRMIIEFKKGKRTFGNAMFAVMGGKASEGIDLPGDYLISAIIVGIPLGKMQLETKSKIEYYDKKYKKGWEYAYIQPAIQKAIQSAGRVIRSIDDRGVIVYLDGRYAWRPLQLIHPALYVSLVHQITEERNWKTIVKRFSKFTSNKKIKCMSLPIRSETKQSDKATLVSNWWRKVEQKSIELALDYQYLFVTDVSDCYGSLYTHSIVWALHDKKVAKKKREDDKLIGNVIDWHLQDMSFGQTNGIPQGSTLMDFISEMVLGYADSQLSEKIAKSIKNYTVIRYRDDYRVFVNNPQDGEAIIKSITEVLADLGMKLNPHKTTSSHEIVRDS